MTDDKITAATNAVIGAWRRGESFEDCRFHIASIVEPLAAEIERLHEFCKELWWARRNLAFGPAGEKQVLAEFPWITEPIRAAEAAGGSE